MANTVTCSDLRGGESCCTSCHEDWAEGYDEPMEVELPDGQVAEVCCAKARSIEKGTAEWRR